MAINAGSLTLGQMTDITSAVRVMQDDTKKTIVVVKLPCLGTGSEYEIIDQSNLLDTDSVNEFGQSISEVAGQPPVTQPDLPLSSAPLPPMITSMTTAPISAVSPPPLRRYRVGVLGATGTVGQRFVQLLADHPFFDVTVLAASEKSAGKPYFEAAVWKLDGELPDQLSDMKVVNTNDFQQINAMVDLLFSALDPSVAGEVETKYSNMGVPVFTNAKNHRYDTFVPIILPQTNSEHLNLIKQQECYKQSGGYIVANSNCSTAGIAVALKPIIDKFGVELAIICTLQATSGAGYPGVPSLDILGNVVPFVSGEEQKIEVEPRKILGTIEEGSEDGVLLLDVKLSAMCHRVPVIDGHTASISLKLKDTQELIEEELVEAVSKCLTEYKAADPDVATLPSAPENVLTLRKMKDRPQPRLDTHVCKGMSVVVGRVRTCDVLDVKFTTVSHNTVLGAAGGSLLNAELAVKKGYVEHRQVEVPLELEPLPPQKNTVSATSTPPTSTPPKAEAKKAKKKPLKK